MGFSQSEQFYSIIDLHSAINIGEVFRYQTNCDGFSREYKGKMYEEYICLDMPVSATKMAINSDLTITFPNMSARDGVSFTRDWLMENDELRGWMVRIAWFRVDAPNWVIDFIPWLISSVEYGKNEVSLTLTNPTNLIAESGKLVSVYNSDQRTPHLPRS